MKKLFAFVLALLLSISITACDFTPADTSAPSSGDSSLTVTDTSAAMTTTTTTTKQTTTKKKTTTTKKKKATTKSKKTEIPKPPSTTKRPTTTTPVAKKPGCTPLLYKVTHTNGGVVWLLGSVHVGSPDMYPLPDYVLDAFYAADALAVECDVEAVGEMTMINCLKQVIYRNGTTIQDHVDSSVYAAAKKVLEENGDYFPELDYYKPVVWADLLSVYSETETGYDGAYGVDLHLLDLAKEKNKRIDEIETAESQYKMLGDFSDNLQQLLLMDALYALEEQDTVAQESLDVVKLWREGNEEALRRELTITIEEEEPVIAELLEEYKEGMITKRDRVMAEYVEAKLYEAANVFVCVGAAHVVGEGGMIDRLKQWGYTVERVSS